MAGRNIFRSEALQKLRDPEQLDTALRLTTPKGWLALAVLGGIVVAVLVWSVVGIVPFRSQGFGVLLHEHGALYDVVANSTGIVDEFSLQVGDPVREGDRVAVIRVPDQEAQIAGARSVLDSLLLQRNQVADENAVDIAERRRNTADRVAALEALTAANRQRLAILREILADQEVDLAQGYVTRTQVEETMGQVHELEQQIRLNANRILESETEQLEYENRLRLNLSQLDQQIVEQRSRLDELMIATDVSRDVLAPADGIVVDVSTKPGTFVQAGGQIVLLESTGGELHLVAYFPIQQGKKLEPGMTAEVSPTNVERDIYGSIAGTVVEVGDYPETEESLLSKLGNQAMAEAVMKSGPPIEVVIRLELDPSTESGFAWSSSAGPPLQITSGTTASVAVTVREDRPVALLLPILETWFAPDDPE